MLAGRAPLARGGGGGFGFARTARQAFTPLEPLLLRGLERSTQCASRARPTFDHGVDAQFPAFRSRDVLRVPRARGGRQRLERILPEWSDEFVTVGGPPLQ